MTSMHEVLNYRKGIFYEFLLKPDTEGECFATEGTYITSPEIKQKDKYGYQYN